MNCVNYLLTGKSMNPGFVGTPTSPNLGDDHEIIRVRMQRLLNNLIGHVGTVEVACVDMIDPRLYRLAKNRNCGISIARRSPDPRTGQLHCTIARPVDSHCCAGQSETAGKISLLKHFVPPDSGLRCCYNHLMKDSSGLEFALW